MTKKRPDRESQEWKPPQESVRVYKAVLDDFPYPHTDFWGSDHYEDGNVRDDKLVFGVPRDHEQGMAFYHVDNEGAELHYPRPEFNGENPECPFHNQQTVVTKEFDFPGVDRVQFKCPECYLTRYRNGESGKLDYSKSQVKQE